MLKSTWAEIVKFVNDQRKYAFLGIINRTKEINKIIVNIITRTLLPT